MVPSAGSDIAASSQDMSVSMDTLFESSVTSPAADDATDMNLSSESSNPASSPHTTISMDRSSTSDATPTSTDATTATGLSPRYSIAATSQELGGATDLTPVSTTNADSQNNTGTAIIESLRIFTLFPKLPTELRLRVWEDVCYHTRNIPLGTVTLSSNHVDDIYPFVYISGCPPPSILSANRESRTIGLKHYELELGNEFDLGHGAKIITPARIYLNFESDRICPLGKFTFEGNDFGRYWFHRVALNCHGTENKSYPLSGITSRISRFPLTWFDGNILEVLLYDENIELEKTRSLEFEDTDLATMDRETQERVEGVKSRLELVN